MVRVFFVALLVAPFVSFSTSAAGLPEPATLRDSVGVEYKNGKMYVQHKVEPKETLFALSRKYGVSVAQIVEANPIVDNSIKIGQIVLIPRKGGTLSTIGATRTSPAATNAAPVASASNRTFVVTESGDKIHVVEPKQTLFSISRLYNVPMEKIKAWNNLSSNQVNIGARLVVGKNVVAQSTKPQYLPEPDDAITKDSPVENATAAVESTIPAETNTATEVPATTASSATAPAEKETTTATNNTEENIAGVKKVLESGLAEMIDPKTDSNKYLALHKSAPVGTIMQVKNAMNDQVVYVRVIGKLPNTGENEKVIVRLSKKAYQKLGAVDQRFRVDLSYVP